MAGLVPAIHSILFGKGVDARHKAGHDGEEIGASEYKSGEVAMLFSMHALDAPGTAAKRQAVHGEHVAHLKTAKDYGVTVTVGGPLLSDDGKTSIGSLMVLAAPDRAAAEKFNRADPFHKNGVWAKVEIQRFDRKE
jgi:uncharacterized protein YciI